MGGNEISLYCFTTGLFNDFIVIADIFFRRSGFLFYIGFRFLFLGGLRRSISGYNLSTH